MINKPIVISIKNRDRLSQAIADVQEKTKEREIDVDDLFRAINDVERELGIPKCSMIDTKVYVDMNAQEFPNAYKYTPYSTQFTMRKTAKGWNLIDIRREICKRPSNRYILVLSNDAKEAIIESKTHFS